MIPCIVFQYVEEYPTRCSCILLVFISRSLHVSGIHHAHHQEYSTASAAIGITYERWFVKCMVESAFKAGLKPLHTLYLYILDDFIALYFFNQCLSFSGQFSTINYFIYSRAPVIDDWSAVYHGPKKNWKLK
jgi:hypothetical protein